MFIGVFAFVYFVPFVYFACFASLSPAPWGARLSSSTSTGNGPSSSSEPSSRQELAWKRDRKHRKNTVAEMGAIIVIDDARRCSQHLAIAYPVPSLNYFCARKLAGSHGPTSLISHTRTHTLRSILFQARCTFLQACVCYGWEWETGRWLKDNQQRRLVWVRNTNFRTRQTSWVQVASPGHLFSRGCFAGAALFSTAWSSSVRRPWIRATVWN